MNDLKTLSVLALAMAMVSGKAVAQSIHEAARAGDVATARTLIQEDPTLVNSRDQAENTPLHFAARAGSSEVVRLLLDADADVNAANYEGETPLHWAVLSNRLAAADLLLRHGARTEARESYGRTPLLLVARETGDLEMASRLLDGGADANAQDRSGSTPLELSAWRGFREVVDLLLDRGAQLPADPRTLSALLREATDTGLPRLFRLVVERGVNLDAPNGNGGTFLHSAAAGGSAEIARTLLDHGLRVDVKDRYGRVPLHYAAENGRTDVVRLLLERGADPNVRSLAGFSPLDAARAFDRTDAVRLLVDHGAVEGGPIFPPLTGPYLGQPAPGARPELFAPDMVSAHTFEHGTVVFSPDGREAFWNAGLPVAEPGYSYGMIATSRLENGRWTLPERAPFSRPRIGDDVPFFHPDGSRLFFLSSRDGDGERIWWVERTATGWSEPHRIEGGPNTKGLHWQFSVAADGSIYFGSGDPGGMGGGDLYVSRFVGGRYAEPVNLGGPVNSELMETAPFIAPDESYLLFARVRAPDALGMVDLYVSFRDTDGRWTEPRNLGPRVNSQSNEICPVVSADGRYLFFNSQRNGNGDNYWMDASVIEELRRGA